MMAAECPKAAAAETAVDARLSGKGSSGKPGAASRQGEGERLPPSKMLRVALISVFSATGSMLFGLDIGYIGPIVESSSFRRDVIHTEAGDIPSATEGLIVSLFSIGAMVTACPLVSSYFLDTWGRKLSIMIGSGVFIVGSILQGAASTSGQLLAGRFVAGMSIGLLSSVIVLYQSELAPASLRGALATLYQLGITFGILLAAFIDELIVDRSEGWRLVMGLICLPAAVLLCGMLVLPRSPRWLVQQGRRREALAVLLTIRTEEDAVREEQEIHEEMAREMQEEKPAWSELLHGRVLRLLVLGVALQLLQQLCGMNAFMYFGPKIFESIGFSKNLFTTINNLVNFLSTFPAVALADRSGRRKLMFWSTVGMTVSCAIMGTTGLLCVTRVAGDPAVPGSEEAWVVSSKAGGWVIAASAFFFVFNFAYGLGPIVWVYCAEIFPLRHRARCIGVCTMANWVGNFLIAQFTPMLLSSVQFSTFYVFGVFCLAGVFLSAWIPETKGVPLELVQTLFDKKAGFKSTASGDKRVAAAGV